MVGQGLQESDDIGLLGRIKLYEADQVTLEGVGTTIAGIRPTGDQPATGGIEIEGCLKAFNAPVMHVRPRYFDIAQTRGAELAHIVWLATEFDDTTIRLRESAFTVDVV